MCIPVSKEEEEEIELVRTLVSAERREVKNIVTLALLLESWLLQGSKFCFCFVVFFYFGICVCVPTVVFCGWQWRVYRRE